MYKFFYLSPVLFWRHQFGVVIILLPMEDTPPPPPPKKKKKKKKKQKQTIQTNSTLRKSWQSRQEVTCKKRSPTGRCQSTSWHVVFWPRGKRHSRCFHALISNLSNILACSANYMYSSFVFWLCPTRGNISRSTQPLKCSMIYIYLFSFCLVVFLSVW